MIAVRAKARKLVGRRLPHPMLKHCRKAVTAVWDAQRKQLGLKGPMIPAAEVAKLLGVSLLLALAGCATPPAPRVIETPNVCPALPKTPPEASAALADTLPVLNEAATTPDARASELLRVRVESAAQYQACLSTVRALSDWARNHSEN